MIESKTINEDLNKILRNLKNPNDKKISTSFYDLDYKINRLDEGKLIAIASRPGIGKTHCQLIWH